MERWTTSANSVYNIGYHLIWCSKYRRKLLTGEIERRLRELIKEKTQALNVQLISFETMPDHVHLFVKCKPTYAPHQIIKQLKGYTSRILRQEFSAVRSRVPSLWTNSYYCESVGHISEETIKRYIEDQKNK